MRALLVVLLVAACGDSTPASTACNGKDALCARRYDEVTFPGTHDADSNIDDGFGFPDQDHGLARQLADGVRVLHWEIYPSADDGSPALCHSVCAAGETKLSDGLAVVKQFTDAHPREVVTLLMEATHFSHADVAPIFVASGIVPSLYVKTDAPWPMLSDMITSGRRVVAYLDGTFDPSLPWLNDRWATTWETPWDNERLADFTRCNADRGAMSNSIYVVDTYLEDLVVPTAKDAARVNYDPFLVERALHCEAVTGRRANDLMVNFYDVSDLFQAVDILNGFAAAPTFDTDMFPAPVDGGTGD